MQATQKLLELNQEKVRLEAKLLASEDRDIRDALQLKLDSVVADISATKAKVAEEAEVQNVIAEPKLQLKPHEIELLVRKGRVAMTGNKKDELRAALAELKDAAPNDPDYLELLADSLLLNKDNVGALKVLKQARVIAPQNVNIEKKLAEVAIRATTYGSLEDQMRAELGGNPLIGTGDITAGATYAALYSLILPGLGHILTGQNKKGFAYAITWLACIAYLVWEESFFKGIVALVKNTNADITLFPIMVGFVAVMIHMVSIFECAALAKRKPTRKQVEHPRPPVDLPYE